MPLSTYIRALLEDLAVAKVARAGGAEVFVSRLWTGFVVCGGLGALAYRKAKTIYITGATVQCSSTARWLFTRISVGRLGRPPHIRTMVLT